MTRSRSDDLRRSWRQEELNVRTPWWFKAWFAFCAVVGLTAIGGLGWLVYAIIQWLGRH